MKFQDFENAMSTARMSRYLAACGGNSKKAMTLYRFNLRASQEFFTVICCFEVTLRNAIDRHYTNQLGDDWLRNSGVTDGNLITIIADSRNGLSINQLRAYRIIIHTKNWLRKWILVFGVICLHNLNLEHQGKPCFVYFPQNRVVHRPFSTIKRLFLIKLDILTKYETVLPITSQSVFYPITLLKIRLI